MSDTVGMGLLLPHIPSMHLLGSRKYVPLHLGSIPRCAQVPEGLAMGDQSSVLCCWAGAMSRAAFARLPNKQQGCPGASQPPFSPVAGLCALWCIGASMEQATSGFPERKFSTTGETPLCWVIPAQPGT